MAKKSLTAFLATISLGFLSIAPHAHALDSSQLIKIGGGKTISRIHPLELHDGANNIPHYIPNGHDAIIFQSWRDNGNRHGYMEWTITEDVPHNPYHLENLINIHEDTDNVPHDTVYNDPFDTKHALKEVMFGRAIIDQEIASVMIIATRDLQEDDDLETPVPVNVAIYRIMPKRHDIGTSAFVFREVGSILTTEAYCSPRLALAKTLYISLPENYTADRIDGCH